MAPNKEVNRVIKNNTLLFTPEYENVISETDKVKDLGIFFYNELLFTFQRYVFCFECIKLPPGHLGHRSTYFKTNGRYQHIIIYKDTIGLLDFLK